MAVKQSNEPTLDPDIKRQHQRLMDMVGQGPAGGVRVKPSWDTEGDFREYFEAVVAAAEASADDARLHAFADDYQQST